jgi:hypothetical protein
MATTHVNTSVSVGTSPTLLVPADARIALVIIQVRGTTNIYLRSDGEDPSTATSGQSLYLSGDGGNGGGTLTLKGNECPSKGIKAITASGTSDVTVIYAYGV